MIWDGVRSEIDPTITSIASILIITVSMVMIASGIMEYKAENVKIVKEKKGINLFSIVLLPLKIMIVPIIIVLSILLILLKLISFATWIVSKVLIVAAIAVTSIHGYQIYMGATMDIRIFVVAAAVGISSIFIPYIVKTVPTIIEAINNKLKDFAF